MPDPELLSAFELRFGATRFAQGLELPVEHLLEALRALRDAHGYRHYVLATATERPEHYELLHGLRNVDTADTLFLKVKTPKAAPAVPSAAFVFAGAEWYEREIWDLFGIGFDGHPDLRRILMPDEYEGHPLRKDFALDTPWGYRPPTRAEGGA